MDIHLDKNRVWEVEIKLNVPTVFSFSGENRKLQPKENYTDFLSAPALIS